MLGVLPVTHTDRRAELGGGKHTRASLLTLTSLEWDLFFTT